MSYDAVERMLRSGNCKEKIIGAGILLYLEQKGFPVSNRLNKKISANEIGSMKTTLDFFDKHEILDLLIDGKNRKRYFLHILMSDDSNYLDETYYVYYCKKREKMRAFLYLSSMWTKDDIADIIQAMLDTHIPPLRLLIHNYLWKYVARPSGMKIPIEGLGNENVSIYAVDDKTRKIWKEWWERNFDDAIVFKSEMSRKSIDYYLILSVHPPHNDGSPHPTGARIYE
jgi:hypothetical protein